MQTKYDVYLGGAITGRSPLAVTVERTKAKELCKKYNVRYYDPAEHEFVGIGKTVDVRPTRKRLKWYIPRDKKAVKESKFFLNITGDTLSSGTGWEMGWAKDYKRHIVLVAPEMANGEITNFTTVLVDKICYTTEDAIKYIARRT